MKELNYLDITKTNEGHIKLPSANGIHPDMGVGTAQQIQTNIHESDSTPYGFRPTPFNSTRESGDIVGASVAWNQLCNGSSVTVPNGHKYYLSKGGTKSIGASNGSAITGLTSGTDMVVDLTLSLGSAIADYIYTLESGTAGAGVAKLREWGFFTSPYYAYTAGAIESVNVSKHRMVGFNAWDETLENGSYNGTTGLDVDDNRYFRTTNAISVLPNTEYYVKKPSISMWVYCYDAAGNYVQATSSGYITLGSSAHTFTTLANVRYVKFVLNKNTYGTSYNHDICVNISNPAVNGQYEPYTVHEYPLDPDLTLRGILKLDGSNNLYADGDVYEADGTVTRKYAERSYQAGDESLANAITDGTTTVYKLTTPTTETADPYTNPQVCSPYGTEEYVDAGVVAGTRDVAIPVGHNTEYLKNIVGAIEGIPLPPSANGTYTLKVTVASGVPTYSWVSG